MRRVDIFIGAFSVAFCGLVLSQSIALDFYQRSGIPGPGFFPTLLAIAIGILGVLLIATRILGGAGRFGQSALPSQSELSRVLVVWLAFLIAALALDAVGFVVTSAALIAVLLFGVERLRSPGAVLTLLLIPLACYVVFVLLLRVELPTGPWGF